MKEPTLVIKTKTKDTVDREIYEIEFNGKPYTYIDCIDKKDGTVVDVIVKDQHENYIADPEIVQELIQFVYEQQQ